MSAVLCVIVIHEWTSISVHFQNLRWNSTSGLCLLMQEIENTLQRIFEISRMK